MRRARASLCLFLDPSLIFFLFGREQEEDANGPNPQQQTGDGPGLLVTAALASDQATQKRVDGVNQSGCAQESSGVQIRLDEIKPGEIAQNSAEVHVRPLTLPSSP